MPQLRRVRGREIDMSARRGSSFFSPGNGEEAEGEEEAEEAGEEEEREGEEGEGEEAPSIWRTTELYCGGKTGVSFVYVGADSEDEEELGDEDKGEEEEDKGEE
ncbi:hypothetical protein NMY22_g18510 [Coprinellus aureogranulatus]|nr:hypothetical protein NMY22_g18510 [Coprinellus aureogranulatus]